MGKNILITGSSSFLGNSLISNDKENIYFVFGNRGSKNFNIQPINNVNEIKKLEIKDLYHFANFQNENKDFVLSEEKDFISSAVENGITNILYSNTFWTDVDIYKDRPYVIHKKNIENFLTKLVNVKKIKLCVMMLGDIYGKNDFREKLIPFLVQNENKKLIKLKNNKDAEVNLVNVRDILDFVYTVNFNIEYEKVDLVGDTRTLFSIIETFKSVRDKEFQTEYSNLKLDTLNYESTCDRNIKLKISIEDGFKDL